MLEIGSGIHDITAVEPGVGLMGYVKMGNVVEGVETPLSARAFVLKDPESGRKVVMAVADICFITLAVKQGVMDRLRTHHPDLGYDATNVLLSATHTHSAPGGYSHHFFFNSSIPGFVPAVYQAIVEGITAAIVQADQAARPGAARLAAGEFPPEVPVAFNRALKAHNANRDVTPLAEGDRHLAVDREMTLLRFDHAGGAPCGCMNWFAVHATSVNNANTRISPDNKGYAALCFEEAAAAEGHAGFVAAFAQGAAGDVTPHFQPAKRRGEYAGAFEDSFESARHNGRLQYEQARALFAQAEAAAALNPTIDAVHMWADMANVEIPADLADGEAGHRTSHAAIGARMLRGTPDGRGIPALGYAAVEQLSRASCKAQRLAAHFLPPAEREAVLAKLKSHGNKAIFMETGIGRVLGSRKLLLAVLPSWIDQTVGHVKVMKKRQVSDEPWTPHVLPLQLVLVGDVAFAAVPGEFTTQSGRRLKRLLLDILAPRGVSRVVIAGYANAYSGYVTTPEEYDLQGYEGASTHFGRWTQPAYMAKFRELALELLKPPAERRSDWGVEPAVPAPGELLRFCHEEVPAS